MAKMNKNYGLFGLAVQTAQQQAATAPTVSFHASGDSNGLSAEKTVASLDLTKGSPVAVSSYVDSLAPKFEATTLGFPDMLALLAYAALGKVETEGSAAPYTHTITPGESLPYLTVFEQKGSASAALARLIDAKVDSLKLSAEGVKPISFDMVINGCVMEWLTATSWSGPAFKISDGYFTLANAEVLFSLSTGTPVAVPAGVNLSKLELEIANSVSSQAILGSPVPGDQTESGSVITVNIEGTSDSTELYREVMTGSKTGTSLASTVVTGSLQMTFKHNSNEDIELVLNVPAIPWTCDVMAVSTEGGPFDLKLSTEGALDPGDENGSIQLIINTNHQDIKNPVDQVQETEDAGSEQGE